MWPVSQWTAASGRQPTSVCRGHDPGQWRRGGQCGECQRRSICASRRSGRRSIGTQRFPGECQCVAALRRDAGELAGCGDLSSSKWMKAATDPLPQGHGSPSDGPPSATWCGPAVMPSSFRVGTRCTYLACNATAVRVSNAAPSCHCAVEWCPCGRCIGIQRQPAYGPGRSHDVRAGQSGRNTSVRRAPSGTPKPVLASQPVDARKPALSPATMSRNASGRPYRRGNTKWGCMRFAP